MANYSKKPTIICLLLQVTFLCATIFFFQFYHTESQNYTQPRPARKVSIQDWVNENLTNTSRTLPDIKSIRLVVGIVSAATRVDRRMAIRQTWFQDCNNSVAVCRFFTDGEGLEPVLSEVLRKENNSYSDLEFMKVPRGINFGRRLLWMMKWALEKYNFDFFLRIDDDQFLCLKRLIAELPLRPKERLIWGHVHCERPGLVRVDEGLLFMTSDLIHYFHNQRDNLLCHPYGDQMVAMWMNDVIDVTYFHDARILHRVSSAFPELLNRTELCHTFLSLHGSYPDNMKKYWEISQREDKSEYSVTRMIPLFRICPYSRFYDWRKMGGPPYGWEPKPCSQNPSWTVTNMFRGRGG